MYCNSTSRICSPYNERRSDSGTNLPALPIREATTKPLRSLSPNAPAPTVKAL
jgi:hypothetical protein